MKCHQYSYCIGEQYANNGRQKLLLSFTTTLATKIIGPQFFDLSNGGLTLPTPPPLRTPPVTELLLLLYVLLRDVLGSLRVRQTGFLSH